MRVGIGYDVHRLVEERALIIGGVQVPYEKGLLGHSDADVLLHAIMDAILGAAALGDIGQHFPDSDSIYKGASSLKLLAACYEKISQKHYCVHNIDAVICAQAPKMAPYLKEMCEKIAAVLEMPLDAVNIKATTTERLGFVGNGEGISAYAVCSLEEHNA